MELAPSHLRPLNLNDILDVAFRLYRNNFVTFLGIAALLLMPFIILQLVVGLALNQGVTTDLLQMIDELPLFDPTTDSFADLPLGNLFAYIGVSLGLSIIQAAVVQQLINGALANAISRRYLNQPISILGAYDLGLGKIVALIAAGFLVVLISGLIFGLVFGCAMGGFVLIFASTTQQSGAGAALAALVGFFGLLAVGIGAALIVLFVAVRLLFVTQAIVLEDHGPISALGRSWRLTGGSFWRVLGIMLLINLLVYILTLIPSALLGGIIGAVFNTPETFILQQTLSTLIGYLIQILVLPFLLIAYTLLYYDLRVRKEGFDLQLRAEGYPPAYS